MGTKCVFTHVNCCFLHVHVHVHAKNILLLLCVIVGEQCDYGEH